MKVFGTSHVGNIREINEDSLYNSSTEVGSLCNLFLIADGMGGHNAGEVASKLAVDSFVDYVKENNTLDVSEALKNAVEHANNAVYNQAEKDQNLHGMGTTFVACCVDVQANKIQVVNVGDSRLYAYNKQLDQITIDHSYVEELIRMGNITREEGFSHPDRNIITKALGTEEYLSGDQYKMSLDGIEKIFLCSDGLSDMIEHERLESVIASDRQPEAIVEDLLNMALEAGGKDNITLILIDLRDEMEVS